METYPDIRKQFPNAVLLVFAIIASVTSRGQDDAVLYNETSSQNFSVTLYVHSGWPCSSFGQSYEQCLGTGPNSSNNFTMGSFEFVATVKVHCDLICFGAQVASESCTGSNTAFQCGGSGPWYVVYQSDNEVRIDEQ